MSLDTLPRFDFKAACRDIAAPAVASLAADVLDIYRALRDSEEYENLSQTGPNLTVPMPENLRARFEGIPSEALAYAARALYSFGHWSGQLDVGRPDKRGATWKFANLADQVLRERLGGYPNVYQGQKSIGYTFEVHEGMLRLCASSPDSWTWVELGPATDAHMGLARAWRSTLVQAPADRYRRASLPWELFEKAAHEATRTVPAVLRANLSDAWISFLDVGARYMREPGKGTDDCPECGACIHIFRTGDSGVLHKGTCSQYPHIRLALDTVERHIRTYMEKMPSAPHWERMLAELEGLREHMRKEGKP